MKKQFAIFAFLIFFFSHFGKVINFCLCSITVYQQTNSFHCDCEKQLVTATAAEEGKHHHSTMATLPQADELFHLDNSAAFTCAQFTPVIIYLHSYTEPLHNGYCNNIFHPPGRQA